MNRGPATERRRPDLGLDSRMMSMLLALVALWVVFGVATEGLFLTPRNLYNLSVQTSLVAVVSCGMVFVIVARQMALSTGSLLAFTGGLTAYAQVQWLAGARGAAGGARAGRAG